MATWISIVALLGLVAIQTALVAVYCHRLSRAEPAPGTFQPPAAVVLCLRGADPFLQQCLAALSQQNYLHYRIVCVLDDADDPAAQILETFLQTTSGVNITRVVAGPANGKCGLKNHVLVAALEHVHPSIEVVALVDADTVVDERWLSDLVAPLQDESTVVCSGSRWFVPPDHRWGTMVRYLWQLAASVQMYVYRIPWGGSLAVRLSYVRETDLLDRWSHSLFEDTQLTRHVQENGKRMAMVPVVLMANAESIDLPAAYRWMRRQLYNVKLYHGKFLFSFAHCISTTTLMTVLMLISFVALISNQTAAGLVALGGLIGYVIYYLWIWNWLQSCASRVLELRQRRGHTSPRIPMRVLIGGILLTQLTYFWAMMSGLFARKISWRGINYRVFGPFDVRMDEYRRMSEVSAAKDADHSIEA